MVGISLKAHHVDSVVLSNRDTLQIHFYKNADILGTNRDGKFLQTPGAVPAANFLMADHNLNTRKNTLAIVVV